MQVAPKEVERIYASVPEFAFCPKCHRRVQVPAFLKTNMVKGTVRITCHRRASLKTKACCGVIVIKPPIKAEPVEVSADAAI